MIYLRLVFLVSCLLTIACNKPYILPPNTPKAHLVLKNMTNNYVFVGIFEDASDCSRGRGLTSIDPGKSFEVDISATSLFAFQMQPVSVNLPTIKTTYTTITFKPNVNDNYIATIYPAQDSWAWSISSGQLDASRNWMPLNKVPFILRNGNPPFTNTGNWCEKLSETELAQLH